MKVRQWREGEWAEVEIPVPLETPLTLVINDVELVTMMVTPVQLKEVVVGFLRTSELIDSADDLVSISLLEQTGRAEVVLRKYPGDLQELFSKRYITSGCGGGQVFIDPALLDKSLTANRLSISPAGVTSAIAVLLASASMYQQSGGIHGSAMFAGDEMLFLAEDIGRHNTFDKLIGAAVLAGVGCDDDHVVTTGRISAEMVAKAAKVGICILVSRTSPTSMAVAVAKALGMTLIGYARRASFNVYSHEQRVIK